MEGRHSVVVSTKHSFSWRASMQKREMVVSPASFFPSTSVIGIVLTAVSVGSITSSSIMLLTMAFNRPKRL